MNIYLSFRESSFNAFVGCVMEGDFDMQSIVKECLQERLISCNKNNEIIECNECDGDYYFSLPQNLITSVMIVVERNRIDECKQYWGKR